MPSIIMMGSIKLILARIALYENFNKTQLMLLKKMKIGQKVINVKKKRKGIIEKEEKIN